jgi:hypothetical protein
MNFDLVGYAFFKAFANGPVYMALEAIPAGTLVPHHHFAVADSCQNELISGRGVGEQCFCSASHGPGRDMLHKSHAVRPSCGHLH